ncbi:MAG TPA: hypothetical protein VFD82_22360 [Planctomycetota bacterium]|nr:hypothetical protein [Planctomycetota bacterium]
MDAWHLHILDGGRKVAAKRVLGELAAAADRSKNLREMLDRTLA